MGGDAYKIFRTNRQEDAPEAFETILGGIDEDLIHQKKTEDLRRPAHIPAGDKCLKKDSSAAWNKFGFYMKSTIGVPEHKFSKATYEYGISLKLDIRDRSKPKEKVNVKLQKLVEKYLQ